MISTFNGNGKPIANFSPPSFMAKIREGVERGLLRTQGITRGVERNDSDPSFKIPGMAPNFSQYMLPHVTTFQGFFGTFSRVYRTSDEALNDSWENARFMRNDPGIMECVEARQRAVALLPWHIEAEDEKSPEQQELVGEMTKILERIRSFMLYRFTLQHAIWFGRYAIQHRFGWQQIGGQSRVLPQPQREDYGWKPIHGDKLVWRYEDSHSRQRIADQLGIRVGQRFGLGDKINQRWEVEPTDRGLAYFLADWERPLLSVHKFMIEDGAFESPMDAGMIHGIGIRHRIYWEWFQKQEALAFLMEFLERSASGVEVHYYPEGNATAKANVEVAIKERISNGHNVMMYPRPAGDDAMQYGVEFIEPGTAGLDMLINLLDNYYGHRIKRYILGQILSSESEATGLGSGVADLHKDTLLQIIKFDATCLQETIEYDLLRNLQHWNFPKSKHIHLRFVIDVEGEDVQESLEAMSKAFEMGARLKEQDVLNRIGAEPPSADDVVLSKSQQMQQEQQSQMAMMGGGMGAPGGAPPQAPPDKEPYDAQSLEDEMLRYVFGDPNNAKQGEVTYVTENGRWKKRTIPEFDTGDRHREADAAPYAAGKDQSGDVFALDNTLKPTPKEPAKPEPKSQKNLPGILPDYKTPSLKGQKELFARVRQMVDRYRQAVFREEEHPRDTDGKFAEKPGGRDKNEIVADIETLIKKIETRRDSKERSYDFQGGGIEEWAEPEESEKLESLRNELRKWEADTLGNPDERIAIKRELKKAGVSFNKDASLSNLKALQSEANEKQGNEYFQERLKGEYHGKPYAEMSRAEMFEAIVAGEEIPARIVSKYPGLLKEAKAARGKGSPEDTKKKSPIDFPLSDLLKGGKFDPAEAPEPPVKRLPFAKRDLHGLHETEDGRWIGATLMHVSDLNIDPERFQYKFVGIDPKTGVTTELKEVKQFNPELGGQLLVWFDPKDKKVYVVNGHHRYDLARRSPNSERWGGELSVYFVDAKSAAEARARGALANMAEGRGTAVDAAKFLRDTGKSVHDLKEAGISLKGSIAQNGTILANLSNRIFQKVSNGVVTEGRALAIAGDLQNDHEAQDELFAEISRREDKKGGRPIADAVVAEMAKEYAAVPRTSETVRSLFGDEENRRTLMLERGILKSEIRKALSQEHAAFKAVAGQSGEKREKILERGDINRIDIDRSRQELKKAAIDLDTFDRLVNYKGSISEAINQGAQELADEPRRKKSIINGLVERIRKIARGDEATEDDSRGMGSGDDGYPRDAGNGALGETD